MRAILALEDGTYFEGESFGASGESSGEMVFNTSMSGYQEIITDPSYAGQIVAMTYPHIGNYGVNESDNESESTAMRGLVVRELSRVYSNYRANGSLSEFLNANGIIGIQGVDTRFLTKHIRSKGAMKAYLSTTDSDSRSVIQKAQESPGLVGVDLVDTVTNTEPYEFGKREDPFKDMAPLPDERPSENTYDVIVMDFGAKGNIVRSLEHVGCRGSVVPASTTAEQILAMNPAGVMLSNGPGDPEAVTYAIDEIKKLLGKVPIFGICLGHQLLSLALGGSTFKLKFGHRGGNQPVKDLATGKIQITSQNHGFAVDPDSIAGSAAHGPVKVTHINLNDDTVEGIACEDIPAFSVQYHPEASPGPHDSLYLFTQFVSLMDESAGISQLSASV